MAGAAEAEVGEERDEMGEGEGGQQDEQKTSDRPISQTERCARGPYAWKWAAQRQEGARQRQEPTLASTSSIGLACCHTTLECTIHIRPRAFLVACAA